MQPVHRLQPISHVLPRTDDRPRLHPRNNGVRLAPFTGCQLPLDGRAGVRAVIGDVPGAVTRTRRVHPRPPGGRQGGLRSADDRLRTPWSPGPEVGWTGKKGLMPGPGLGDQQALSGPKDDGKSDRPRQWLACSHEASLTGLGAGLDVAVQAHNCMALPLAGVVQGRIGNGDLLSRLAASNFFPGFPCSGIFH